MCTVKLIKKSGMDVCVKHGELVWKGKRECKMSGKFVGDLKALLRSMGGGSVEMDGEGKVLWVRGKEWKEEGSVWERVWCVEWREVEDGLWQEERVCLRSEARW